jgi:threonine dehydratase
MITIEDISKAKERIHGVVIQTPLIPYVSRDDSRRMLFKPENLQPVGSFKLRGAYNRISSLSENEMNLGIVAHSSGNHAQGVAYSARKLGIKATIVMPQAAPEIKIKNTRGLGAEVILVEDNAELQMQELMDDLASKHGFTMIPPYENNFVIAGQGTIGLEILEQCADVETVVVPIGGGGLIGGIATCLKNVKPGIHIIGVEPEIANDTQQSFEQGKIVSIPKEQAKSTIADGMRVTRPGNLTFPLIQAYVDDIVTVSEDQIIDATRKIITETRLMVEPSGATTFAAWLNDPGLRKSAGKTVCVVSGGNIDPSFFASIMQEG